MKKGLNAFLDKHLNNIVLIFGGIFCVPQVMISNIIVTQFRAPLSLGELLHEGLLSIQLEVEKIAISDENTKHNILINCENKIAHLQNLYDLMNSKSGLHGINANERDFLQSLIDRIDNMIQSLESSSSGNKTSEDDVALTKKNIDLLHELSKTLEY